METNREKILFIVNPQAGQGKAVHMLDVIIPELAFDGSPVTVRFTQRAGDMEEIVAEEGHKFDRIMISGGDGSLNELVNGVLGGKVESKLAYLPTGTTCDFAVNFDYPDTMAEIVRVGRFGTRRELDLGLVNEEKYFVYVASFGAFTDSSYGTPSELKQTMGRLAYVANAIKNMNQITKIPTKIILEDEILEENLLFSAVLNSIQMGGIVKLDPSTVRLNDGYFELIAVRYPAKVSDLSFVLNALMQQDFSHELFIYKKVKSVKFVFESDMALTLDGEFGGNHKSLDIRVLPQAWHLYR